MTPRKWRMRDGKYILITKMSDSHLINTLNMLYRQCEGIDDDGFPTNDYYSEYIEPMEKELKRRGLTTEEYLNFTAKLKREKERITKRKCSYFRRLISKFTTR